MGAASDRAVYQAVTERDVCCRVCGSTQNMERHHIRGRKFTSTQDVVLLCGTCHDFLHVRVGGKRLRVSGNADEQLVVHFRDGAGGWSEARR